MDSVTPQLQALRDRARAQGIQIAALDDEVKAIDAKILSLKTLLLQALNGTPLTRLTVEQKALVDETFAIFGVSDAAVAAARVDADKALADGTPDADPITAWDAATTYKTGDTVFFNTARYTSLTNNNKGNQPDVDGVNWSQIAAPGEPPAPVWDATATYKSGDVVSYLGTRYTSVADGNVGRTPLDSAAFWTLTSVVTPPPVNVLPWDSTVMYATGDLVVFGGSQYRSLIGGNSNLQPDTNPAAWELSPAGVPAAVAKAARAPLTKAVYTPPAWDPARNYLVGERVTYLGEPYKSLRNDNKGNSPSVAHDAWGPLP